VNCFYNVLRFAPPDGDAIAIGVLVYDPAADQLFMRFRSDWKRIYEEDVEILHLLAEDLTAKIQELGALQMLEHLEDTLSNAILISERHELPPGADAKRELETLYASLVDARPT
jgi:hypothetical protein